MTDCEKLDELIVSSGIKRYVIADKLGITAYGLAKKVKGESEFKASEIFKMQKILGISDKTRDRIFFANVVE